MGGLLEEDSFGAVYLTGIYSDFLGHGEGSSGRVTGEKW